MRPPSGLRRRLVLATIATVGLALAVVTAAFYFLLSARLSSDADRVLRTRADAQIATLSVTDGVLQTAETPNDAVLDDRVWVFAANGRAIERPEASTGLQRGVAALARVERPVNKDLRGDVRLLAVPVRARGTRVGAVVTAVSLAAYEHTLQLALGASLALAAVLLAAVALLARRTVSIALTPVAEMTRAAAQWSVTDLDRRFGLGEPRDELTGLAATLDDLLERLSGSLRHEQRFTAEVSHELRTPLAALRADAELALRRERGAGELRAALAEVLVQAERMQAVVEALMAAAEHEAAVPSSAFDVRTAARSALEQARPQAHARGMQLDLAPAPDALMVTADHELTGQILRPLLDNAVRYGRSRVELALARDDGAVTLCVRDDGPGVRPDETDRVFEPGVRGSAASEMRGAGLGLALARRLARAAGGDVIAEASGDGGRFMVRLPAR